MNWNHRLVRVKTHDEVLLCFREVYYDENGKPKGSCDPFLYSETLKGMKQLADRLRKACDQPIINEEDINGDDKCLN